MDQQLKTQVCPGDPSPTDLCELHFLFIFFLCIVPRHILNQTLFSIIFFFGFGIPNVTVLFMILQCRAFS